MGRLHLTEVRSLHSPGRNSYVTHWSGLLALNEGRSVQPCRTSLNKNKKHFTTSLKESMSIGGCPPWRKFEVETCYAIADMITFHTKGKSDDNCNYLIHNYSE